MPEEITPAQQFTQDFASLQSQVNELHKSVRLTNRRDEIEDLTNKIQTLPNIVTSARNRRYVFDKNLEERAASLINRWNVNLPSVNSYIDAQAAQLELALRPFESQLSFIATQSASPEYALSLVKSLKTDLDTLDSKVTAADQSASSMFDELRSEYYQFANRMEKITTMLTKLDEATFRLQANEYPIWSIKSIWTRDGREDKDDPEGILFLTDRRLLFEQNQEVATRKVLFITTERKKVQQVLLDSPLHVVEDILSSKQGLFKNQDFIDLRFGRGASVPMAQFHIFGQEGSDWVSLVKRAKDGDFEKDRAFARDQAEIDKVKSAPTDCPACGAVLDQAIPHGADSITCQYCGQVIRL